mmetsp:Transcript_37661/g.120809  ORF Transcript_37661/g.120809 Transcript_37661/m.120809 type:complete len:212 (+) Transcript_37661:410-1045(+)
MWCRRWSLVTSNVLLSFRLHKHDGWRLEAGEGEGAFGAGFLGGGELLALCDVVEHVLDALCSFEVVGVSFGGFGVHFGELEFSLRGVAEAAAFVEGGLEVGFGEGREPGEEGLCGVVGVVDRAAFESRVGEVVPGDEVHREELDVGFCNLAFGVREALREVGHRPREEGRHDGRQGDGESISVGRRPPGDRRRRRGIGVLVEEGDEVRHEP